MTNVLIRDVPPNDLELIRAAAAAEGTSLQNYLREAVHTHAAYLRRRGAYHVFTVKGNRRKLRTQVAGLPWNDVPGRAHRDSRPAMAAR